MTKFSAYFDDSGHPDDKKFLVVAGFVASEDQWLRFESEWNGHLALYGIETFHMVDFEFSKEWTRQEKDALLSKLLATMRVRTRFHICHTVVMDPYRDINDEYVFEETLGTPYALAGRTVAASLHTWKGKYTRPEDKLLLFFEDGTKHKGDFMDAMARDKLPCPGFLQKKVAPLQAADLAAWEHFQGVSAASDPRRPKYRPLFQSFIEKHPHESGVYVAEALERTCKAVDPPIPLRSNLAPDAEIVHETRPKKLRRRTIGPRS